MFDFASLFQVLLQSKYTVVTANFWYDACFSTLMVTYSQYGVHFVLLGNFGSLDSHQPPKLCCKPVKYVVPPNFPNTNQMCCRMHKSKQDPKRSHSTTHRTWMCYILVPDILYPCHNGPEWFWQHDFQYQALSFQSNKRTLNKLKNKAIKAAINIYTWQN